MEYSQILTRVLVGSHPASKDDIDTLKKDAGVTAVLNLQTDDDMRHLGVDWEALRAHYAARGVQVRRVPVRDFDAEDLRERLPECVRALDQLLSAGHSVYVHCTAGAGRSPSAVIAYLAWRGGWDLDDAVRHVKQRRSCSPNVEVIGGPRSEVRGPGSGVR